MGRVQAFQTAILLRRTINQDRYGQQVCQGATSNDIYDATRHAQNFGPEAG
jgi:hypothetical protein